MEYLTGLSQEAIVAFVAGLLCRQNASLLYSMIRRPIAWAKADCQRTWQGWRDCPLVLQVASALAVLNMWGFIALETYAGVTIDWLQIYPAMFFIVAFGAIGYFGARRLFRRAGRKGI